MYRTIECHTWDDEWFQELDPAGKLTFLYLLTNIRQTACGAFRITLRTISLDTGLPKDQIEAALDTLQEAHKCVWFADEGVVWVRNFYKNQRANSSWKFAVSAQRALKEFPQAVQDTILIAYPELAKPLNKEDTLSVPYADPTDRGHAETKTEPKQNKDKTNQINSSAATPQAASVEPPPPRQINPVPKTTTKSAPKEKPKLEWPDGFDVNRVWVLVEEDQGYPPNWTYGREAIAVNKLLKKHPDCVPDDFAAFIRYRWKCFRGDPNAQPTFSEVPANFTSWFENGKPEQPVNQKDKTNGTHPPSRMAAAVRGIEQELMDEVSGFGASRAPANYQAGYTPKRLIPPKSA